MTIPPPPSPIFIPNANSHIVKPTARRSRPSEFGRRVVIPLGLLTLTLTLLFCPALGGVALAASTPTFIQERDSQVTSGTKSSVTLPTTTIGNLLVVYVVWDNSSVASVADSAGNTYAGAVGPSRWNRNRYNAQVFYTINRKSGSNTITATFGSSLSAFGIIYVHEYAGVDAAAPIDGTAAAVGSTGSLNSGSVVTKNASDLLFGAGVSANTVTAPGTGFTARSRAQGNITEDRNVTTTGSYAATASNSSDAWAMQLVAFRAAGGGVATDTSAPTVPGSLAATAISGSQINLTWAASTDNVGVAGYQVFRDGLPLGTATQTSYSDAGLTASTTYTYAVAALDAAGNASARSATATATTPGAPGSGGSPYFTNFAVAESPLSDNGNWINGKTTGLSWADVRTSPGLAYGAQSGLGRYDDATAVLTGVWRPDQTTEATVHSVNQNNSISEEVELRLRSTISPSWITGYEINFRCTRDGSQYVQIVRWNGPLGDFTYVASTTGPGIRDGDVVKATIVGNVISAYINGVRILQGSDGAYASGNPGIGFYLQNATGVNTNFGFTTFSASDGSMTTDVIPPSAPTHLTTTRVLTSQVDLSWTASSDNVGVTGYNVFRNGNLIGTTTATQASDIALSAGTQYVYAVSAVDLAGNVSPKSAFLTVTTATPYGGPPSIPMNLQVSGVSSNSLTLTWAASVDDVAVASYQVFRNGVLIGTSSATTYADRGLSPATTYGYSVSAVDGAGNVSPQSDQVLVTTQPGAISPPSLVQLNQNQISRGSKCLRSVQQRDNRRQYDCRLRHLEQQRERHADGLPW